MSVNHDKNLLEVINVSFSYGSLSVLENISLAVHPGDYLGLVGPNGAGKTTLLKLMLGLLRPTSGEIRLLGQEVGDFSGQSRLAYVPQQRTGELDFPITVYEVAAMSLYGRLGWRRRLTSAQQNSIRQALEKTGMWAKKDELIGRLSGGQQQRAYIARALSGQPDIMFLDEPTRGLDQAAQDDLYNLLRDLNTKAGLTIVVVSHDVDKITQEAMHIACLDRHLVCHNSPAEFLADSNLVDMFGQKVKVIGHHHHN